MWGGAVYLCAAHGDRVHGWRQTVQMPGTSGRRHPLSPLFFYHSTTRPRNEGPEDDGHDAQNDPKNDPKRYTTGGKAPKKTYDDSVIIPDDTSEVVVTGFRARSDTKANGEEEDAQDDEAPQTETGDTGSHSQGLEGRGPDALNNRRDEEFTLRPRNKHPK
ncbi:hypothetical protein DL767_004143 [Monosporascus sp. MG133]|nr:hypothetical protein DL767_004143 [Monosporascus sp. MG133]